LPFIEVRDLTKKYGAEVPALSRVTFAVEKGEWVAIMGPSGSGKSTLMNILGCLDSPTEGQAVVDGQDLAKLSAGELARFRAEKVGFVFQQYHLVPYLTAVENVMLAQYFHSLAEEKEAAEALRRVGLADRLQHLPSQLSVGERQRVAIARALALDPPLILADEPTAHLDYVQVEEVLRGVRELAAGERVVVVATHDNRLLPLADQVIELVPQRAVSTLPPARVELQPGEVLFRQGSWGELIYVVERGEIEILAERDDGTEELRTIVTSGSYFGEMGPLFGLPRSATARARTAAVVVGYTTRDFRQRTGPGVNLLSGGSPVGDAGHAPAE